MSKVDDNFELGFGIGDGGGGGRRGELIAAPAGVGASAVAEEGGDDGEGEAS